MWYNISTVKGRAVNRLQKKFEKFFKNPLTNPQKCGIIDIPKGARQ
jgi:hypothetical protein